MPSFILIRPTDWPQYANVTDRTGQTDRQQSDSIGRNVLQMVAQKIVLTKVSFKHDSSKISKKDYIKILVTEKCK